VNIRWIHCIQNFFTVQPFRTTCTCPEKQSFPWNLSLYWLYTFHHSGFWATCACPKKQIWPGILHCIEIFFIIQDVWATCVCPEISTVLNILFTFRIFEQLALALKNRVVLKVFTVLKYFLLFRNFEQLALALKTDFALKFFKPGGEPPPASYAYGIEMKTLYFILLGKWQFQNAMNKPRVHWMDCACLVQKLGVTITTKKEFTYR